AEAGVPMEEVAQYLGHSNPNVTRSTYARFSPDHLRKAASALEFGQLAQVQRTKGKTLKGDASASFNGEPCRNRTCNLSLRRGLRYPLRQRPIRNFLKEIRGHVNSVA